MDRDLIRFHTTNLGHETFQKLVSFGGRRFASFRSSFSSSHFSSFSQIRNWKLGRTAYLGYLAYISEWAWYKVWDGWSSCCVLTGAWELTNWRPCGAKGPVVQRVRESARVCLSIRVSTISLLRGESHSPVAPLRFNIEREALYVSSPRLSAFHCGFSCVCYKWCVVL